MKRGIAGPHRCGLCRNSEETAGHLFLDCKYVKEVWSLTLHEFQITVPSFNTVADLFDAWEGCYPHKIPSKAFWRKIWIAIPKFICWKTWLARNALIFNGKEQTPLAVAAKAKSLLLEAAQQQYYSADPWLLPEEERWLNSLSPSPRRLRSVPLPLNPIWRIRETEEHFQEWWKKQKISTIFFDGASKGNPGAAGAGGVIYDPNGVKRDTFSWGIGQKSNNQAEILSLLKACQIARDRGDKKIQVFGDSELLIKKLNSENQFNNASLNKTLNRVKEVLSAFQSCKCFHILRNLNSEADLLANQGCTLEKGQILINGGSSIHLCNS